MIIEKTHSILLYFWWKTYNQDFDYVLLLMPHEFVCRLASNLISEVSWISLANYYTGPSYGPLLAETNPTLQITQNKQLRYLTLLLQTPWISYQEIFSLAIPPSEVLVSHPLKLILIRVGLMKIRFGSTWQRQSNLQSVSSLMISLYTVI